MRPRIVLTVDDSPTIRKVVQVVLSRRGHETHAAADGEEGLRLAEELRPDLILLDFVMPRMNGYQFCRALAQSEALREVPVVLMSAKGDQIGERFVRVMGIVEYITKPFSPDALVAVVERTLARSRELGADVTSERGRGIDTDPGEGGTPIELLDMETTDAHPIVTLESLTPTPAAAPSIRQIPGVGRSVPAVGKATAVAGGATGMSTPPGGLGAGAAAAHGSRAAGGSPARSEGPIGPRPSRTERVVPSDDKIRDAIARAIAGNDAASAHLAEEVRARLTLKVIARLVDELALGHSAPASATLSGELERVPLGDVLALLAEQKQDGVLEARRDGQAVQICLRAGRIDFVGGEGLGDELRLGNYLVRAQVIGRADLELFFGSRGPTTRLCGEQLIKLGHIALDDVRAALRRQAAERLYEALRMKRGRFELRPLAPDEPLAQRAADASLSLAVDALLLEGSRRVDEWHVAQREIGDDEAVFLRNDEAIAGLPLDALGREEQVVLELINARNTVRDIVRHSRMGAFEVSQLLMRLRGARLIRRRVQPVAV